MSDRGFRIHVLSGPGEQRDKFCREEGVTGQSVSMRRAVSPLHDLVALARLYRAFRRLRPDIVHGHTPKASVLAAIAARLARVPVYVHHLHGMRHSTATGVARWLIHTSEFVACRFSRRVFCVSKSLMTLALKEKLSSPEKLRVLVNGSVGGIDADVTFNPARYVSAAVDVRKELKIPPSARVIGSIGRLARDKGIEDLLAVWLMIKASYPQAVLIIVGAFDSSDPVPQAVLSRLQDDPDIRFVNYTDDVGRYLSTIEVLVFPTHREGFPLVALEANAMEVPVVAYAVTGCVDAVVNEETGILVPDNDVRAMAEAATCYLRNEPLRREHGRKGRERTLRDFNQTPIWEALRSEYCELLAPLPHSAGASLKGALVRDLDETPTTGASRGTDI